MSASGDVVSLAARPHGERPRDHMPCLDGLRGLAAAMVVLGHAGDFGLPTIIDGSSSHCGVLIFFALSGFLMGELYLSTTPTKARIEDYAVARVARIVPIYYVVVVTAFVIHRLHPDFVYGVTTTQLIRLLTFNGSVSVFWSIGPEVQFYAVFVILWLFRDRLKQDGIFLVALLALAAVGLLSIRLWPGMFVASKFHIFALGLAVSQLRGRLLGSFSPGTILVGHAVGLLVLLVLMVPGIADDLLGPTPFDRGRDPAFTSFYGNVPRIGLAGCLVLVFSISSRPAAILLANPVAALLGRWSFSIYLLHVAIYDIATQSGLLRSWPPRAGTLGVLLATIVLSFLTYQIIEVPARRALRIGLMRLLRGGTPLGLPRQHSL